MNIDACMREYIFDHGGRIEKDGRIAIDKERFASLPYTGHSNDFPHVRTWMIPTNNGCCLIYEGKHFTVDGDPAPDWEADLMAAWHKLEDIGFDPETETIQEPFLHFSAGTSRQELWKWFDALWPRGIYNLIYEGGKAYE